MEWISGWPSATVRADETHHQAARFVALVAPGVARTVLHDRIAGLQVDFLPVVQLEPDLAGNYVLEVDRVRGMHAGVAGLHVGGHTGQLRFQFREGALDVKILLQRDRLRSDREDAHAESADRREVVPRRPRASLIRKRRGPARAPQPV